MDSKITRISMSFSEKHGKGKLQYELTDLTNAGLSKFELPFDPNAYTPDDFKMEIFDDQNNRESLDWGFLDFLRKSDGTEGEEDPKIRKYKQQKEDSPILHGLDKNFWLTSKYQGLKFPVLNYADVTERDMFGSDEAKEQELRSPTFGIWSGSGLRKLEMRVDNMRVNRKVRDFEQKGILYWTRIDNEPIPFLKDEMVVYHPESVEDENKDQDIYYVYCDTDQMGEAIADFGESAEPLFEGRFELHFKDSEFKESWAFPVGVCVLDSSKKKLLREDDFVSLDFGTSATCAAYQKDGYIQLLRLSGTNKTSRDRENVDAASEYENPTNLMLYNWEEIWKQWNSDNAGMPLIMTKYEEMPDKAADYDSGHTVKTVYHDTSDEKSALRMDAILTELKTIPYRLSKGREIRRWPINDSSHPVINIIDSGEEDSSHFNPIKLYGYLISRVINQPRENRYYTKFRITYPVKFDDNIKEKIKSSLGEGIIRALPKPIRQGLNPEDCVELGYQESVACIGACVGKQLNFEEVDGEYKPVLFSVFDLGGGTWDTSYGILREPITEEEAEQSSGAVIQILHTGGDEKMGAEHLLHKLAFQIYKMNKDTMVANQIPFLLPEGESIPAGINERFLPEHDANKIPDANRHALIEQIARPFFQAAESVMDKIFDKEMVKSGTELKITLKNFDGEDVKLELVTVVGEGDNAMDLEEYLNKVLMKELVKRFKQEMLDTMEANFTVKAGRKGGMDADNGDEGGVAEEVREALGFSDKDDKFDMSKVQIFLGGNASKQRSLEKLLREEDAFPENEIKRIGDTAEEEEANLNKRITAKTAVSIGQLRFMLNNIVVATPDKHGTIMEYNVGFKDMSDKFRLVLNRSSRGGWVKANKLLPGNYISLHYTASSTDSVKNEELHYLKKKIEVEDPKKRTLFIRRYPLANNAIEYRLGSDKDKAEDLDPNAAYIESNIVRLEDK